MNKINELINSLCPDGVEFRELGSVLQYEQPSKYIVETTKYDDDYLTPVLTAGQTFILGYTNETEGIYEATIENPVIIFDDFTTSFHWVDFNFKVKSSAMKIVTPKKDAKIIFRFIFYAMRCIIYNPQDHARQWISVYSRFQIPIPPLPIQQEIVNILDKFTQLEAELEAELEARKKQYEYYRNRLLSAEMVNGKWLMNGREVEWKKLGEVTHIQRGKRVTKTDLSSEYKYPVYQNCLTPLGNYPLSNCAKNTTFVIVGGAAGQIGFSNVDFWAADDCCFFQSDKIISKYLYHFLLLIQNSLFSKVRKASVPRLGRSVLEKIPIPIPPLSEQERIVGILDKFDALVNGGDSGSKAGMTGSKAGITGSLPAEIEVRRKQYEYYRGKLLNFKPLNKC